MRVLQVGSGKRRFPFASVIALFLIFGTLSVLPQTARAAYYKVTYSGGTAAWETGSAPYSLNSNGWWAGFVAPSSSPRYNAFASCTGAITTTFTWKPSYAGDPAPPPTKVVVYQETSVFTTGSGFGTIDDGLGGSNGVGKRYSIKDSPGNSFTLATVSPSATIGPFFYGITIASVTYKATTAPLEISLSGGIKNNWDKEYLIGQRATAALISGGLTPTTYSWTAGGADPFKKWKLEWFADNATPNTTMVLETLGNQINSTLVCYFKKPATGTVTCTAHLAVSQGALPANGLDVTVSRNCTVRRPESFSFDVYTAKNAAQHPDGDMLVPGVPASGVVIYNGFMMFFGVKLSETKVTGIRWDGKVLTSSANPNPWGTGGGWNFVQKSVIKRFRTYQKPGQNSVFQTNSVNNQNLLDQAYPYAPEPIAPDPAGIFPDNGSINTAGDAPGMGLIEHLISVQADDHFETWMMYRPPGVGSEFVPIKKITWFWQGTAAGSGTNWTVLSSSSDFTIGNDYPEFPEWTGRITATALTTWSPAGP